MQGDTAWRRGTSVSRNSTAKNPFQPSTLWYACVPTYRLRYATRQMASATDLLRPVTLSPLLRTKTAARAVWPALQTTLAQVQQVVNRKWLLNIGGKWLFDRRANYSILIRKEVSSKEIAAVRGYDHRGRRERNSA